MFRNPTTDLIVILVIVLLIFGPKRLPSLGKQLGSGIREFKDGITGRHDDDEAEVGDEGKPPQLTQGAVNASPSDASSATQKPDPAPSERRA